MSMTNTDILNKLSTNIANNKLIEDTIGVLADSTQMKTTFDATYSPLIQFISDLKILDTELSTPATATATAQQ